MLSRVLLLLAMAAVPACAQTAVAPDAKPLVYDVVSIKPSNAAPGSVRHSTYNYSFTATNVSLPILLAGAYGVNQDLITGSEGPLKGARFDIQAKVSDPEDPKKNVSEEQRAAMLQAMLVTSFHLKVHIETKILPVYNLVVLPGGIKFKEMAPNGQRTCCGHIPPFRVEGMPMAILASTLSAVTHRTVIDRTGLTGKYGYTLNWTPDDVSDPDSQWPSLFTAVQEQLGLKLESAKGPVETLVVDHVEMPATN
jgi:uncharacterized protein (TIGR03435 family)